MSWVPIPARLAGRAALGEATAMTFWPLIQLIWLSTLGLVSTLWLDRQLRRGAPLWHRSLSWYLIAAQATVWLWLALSRSLPGLVGLIYPYLAVFIGLTFTSLIVQTLSFVVLQILPRHPPRIFFDVANVLINLTVLLLLSRP
ncbi:MAG: hypothetical protein HC926_05500, partial [Synechococcaceae cyanobacterium SM2_3_60]|nr:hypothetical protein [Synechococcaceae cyanobacterium SM2_3_60]